MCMKNINLIPVYCDVASYQDGSNLALANLGSTEIPIRIRGGERVIPQLSITLFISATQSKLQEEINLINPDTTFSFESQYDIRIRLTETVSGTFCDLDNFLLEPKKYMEDNHLCRYTLNHLRVCLFTNVTLPTTSHPERFVIKALIRRHDEASEGKGWAVQAILPLQQFVDTTEM